jgi:hypothetical protein
MFDTKTIRSGCQAISDDLSSKPFASNHVAQVSSHQSNKFQTRDAAVHDAESDSEKRRYEEDDEVHITHPPLRVRSNDWMGIHRCCQF